MTVEIRIAREDQDMQSFLGLPSEVHATDRYYCRSPSGSVLKELRRASYSKQQQVILAQADGRTVARVVAHVSPSLVDEHGVPYGMLGFFEAYDNAAAVKALFQHATAWLRNAGAGPIIGPINGDTWHNYRLNVGPFDEHPFLMEPNNPAYYAKLWEANGFVPLEQYYSAAVNNIPAASDNTARIAARVASRGYKLRRIEPARLERELETIYRISQKIFAQNFLYSPITLDEFRDLYHGSASLIDPDFVWFAREPDSDEDVGFVFAFPDVIEAVASMRGKRNLIARLRFLHLRKNADTLNIKTLGVLPAFQGTGVAVALMHQVYRMAAKRKFRSVNLCLIRDGNPSGRMEGGQGTVSRRYVLYRLGQ